jgi:L-alanine-DL-glutamate epimerase-like enolase superfamily enzyme
MKIESYKIYKVSIPTRRRHTWASSTADVGQGWVILEVKTDDGIVGYGEATTMPEWGGDFGRVVRDDRGRHPRQPLPRYHGHGSL